MFFLFRFSGAFPPGEFFLVPTQMIQLMHGSAQAKRRFPGLPNACHAKVFSYCFCVPCKYFFSNASAESGGSIYVASTPEFTQQPQVANGLSDLLVEVFGEQGKHARCAFGVASLPMNLPVEAELTVEVAQD